MARNADGKKRRRRWSADEKRDLAARARVMRAEGERWGDICRELNVIETSLRRWIACDEEAAIQPVEIIDMASESAGITLTTPDGFRLEALDLDTALVLVDALR